jgi:hypothetical protein
VTGRTRYGDLLRDAAGHIAAASVAVQRGRFADRYAARDAVSAYRDLLHALNRHGWQLLGSDVRVTGIGGSRDADRREIAAVRLVDELAAVGRRASSDGRQLASAAAAGWMAAAESVRIASDLLSTHREADGAWRSPHAQILDDPAVRAVGFAELAALVVPTAEAATHLGLHAGQAGIGWRDVERLVPQTRTLLDVALEVRGGAGTRRGESPLRSMEVARPAVRLDDPVVELGDRLARLHRMAWQLTRETHVGAGTLADLAAAGAFVHEYGVRLVRLASGSEPGLDAGPWRSLRQAGAAWRLVHLHTRQFRTATPPLLVVRGDVLAIRHLLDRVGPKADREHAHTPDRRLESVILGGARAFTDVARWNSAVLDHLDRTGQLYVSGSLLTGDEVTGHPALVRAKLADWTISATEERIEPLRTAYQAAQQWPSLSNHRTAHPNVEALVPTQEHSAATRKQQCRVTAGAAVDPTPAVNHRIW